MAIAAIFPGQGAQSVGMLADVAEEFPEVLNTFAKASEVLGFDVWSMVQTGPSEVLSQTENTQPILLTASAALWEVWQSSGQTPDFVAGHSLGEYSALVCAGAMSLEEGVALVRKRGELMEAAVPRGQGAMAAIMGLDDDAIAGCCDAADGVVAPANFNAPGQIVIAGAAEAVAQAAQACKDAGAKRAVMLDVSGPFHSPLMGAAKDEFAQALGQVALTMPTIPIVQNVTARVAQDLEQLKENLLDQIAAPVLWSKSVQQMVDLGVDSFVECGPGNVLAGLVRRISKVTPTAATATVDAMEALRGAE
ncbi:MAG: ACP S-malonyltransferase [Pseudomonadota bacterium]